MGRCGVCGGDLLGQGGPGCGCGGVSRTGGGGYAKGRAGINAQQGGGLDDGLIAGLALALHEHSKGLPGDVQGSGQGGGAGVSAAQLLEQFGWAHFDSPAYWRRLPSDFVLARKQLVDVANLCPGLPPVQGSAYGHPAAVLSLVSAPVRGPVVAAITLERVRFSLRTQGYISKAMRGAGGLWPKRRGALELARECGAGWVAWSEPVAGGAA